MKGNCAEAELIQRSQCTRKGVSAVHQQRRFVSAEVFRQLKGVSSGSEILSLWLFRMAGMKKSSPHSRMPLDGGNKHDKHDKHGVYS